MIKMLCSLVVNNIQSFCKIVISTYYYLILAHLARFSLIEITTRLQIYSQISPEVIYISLEVIHIDRKLCLVVILS